MRSRTRRVFFIFISLFVVVVVLLLLYSSSFAKTGADEQALLRIEMLDVGQGDAFLITTPSEQHILIDGGPDRSLPMQLGDYIPFYDREIDLVMVSHPHADHYVGLIDLVGSYTLDEVVVSGVETSTRSYLEFEDKLGEYGVPIYDVWAGKHYDFGEGVTMDILSPFHDMDGEGVNDLNDASIVAKLSYGTIDILFTGDAGFPVEDALLEAGVDLEAEVLKVGHHGSHYSTGDAFLAAVDPEIALISSGEGNEYHHPHLRVLRKLERYGGIDIVRADERGSVAIATDGVTVWVPDDDSVWSWSDFGEMLFHLLDYSFN